MVGQGHDGGARSGLRRFGLKRGSGGPWVAVFVWHGGRATLSACRNKNGDPKAAVLVGCTKPGLFHRLACSAFGEFFAKAPLIEFRNGLTLKLVAFVEEGQAEGVADIAEDLGVLRPSDHGAWRHYGGEIAIHEGCPGQVGQMHHLADSFAACFGVVMGVLGQNDGAFGVMAEVVQRGDQRPAVHLGLVDLLGAVVKARGVAQTDGVGRGEEAEVLVRGDDLVLIKQGEFAVMFQNALDHEHHIGAACVIFVKHDGDGVSQGPRQDAFMEFSDLFAVTQFDGIFADQVNP